MGQCMAYHQHTVFMIVQLAIGIVKDTYLQQILNLHKVLHHNKPFEKAAILHLDQDYPLRLKL